MLCVRPRVEKLQPHPQHEIIMLLARSLTRPFLRNRYDDELHAGAALQGLQVRCRALYPPLLSACSVLSCVLCKHIFFRFFPAFLPIFLIEAYSIQAYRITEEMALKISYVAAASCSKLPRHCPHDDDIFFFFSFADSPKGKADACVGGVHSASVAIKWRVLLSGVWPRWRCAGCPR